MDYNLLSLIIISIIIFAIVIYKAIKNKIDLVDNLYGILIYSFSMTLGVILPISLMVYAITGKIIYGISIVLLHFSIFISGSFLLMYFIISLHNKFNPVKIKILKMEHKLI